MRKFTTKFIATSASFTWVTDVFAHEGHGLSGMHWHATDTLGFVAVVALAAVVIWLSRK